MSFFSDLGEGNFGNLLTDITHAPRSFTEHPEEILETGAAIAAVALPFVAPEIAGAALGGEAALGAGEAAAGGAGLAADLGIGDIAGAAALDAGIPVAGGLAADLGVGDIGGAAALDSAAGLPAASIAPDTLDFFSGGGGGEVFAGGAGGDFLAGGGGAADTLGGFNSGVGSAFDIGAQTTIPPVGGGFDPLTATPTDVLSEPAAATTATTPQGVTAPSNAALGGTSDAALAQPTGGAATPSTTPTATPTEAAGGTLTDKLGSVLNSPWTRLAAGALPLGIALARGEPGVPAQAQQASQGASQVQQFGQQQLARAQNGTLNPGQQAVIDKTRQDLTNTWRQTLFNQGVQDPSRDTRWPQIQANIDAQVNAQTESMIRDNIAIGLQATGQSAQTLTNVAQLQMNSDQQFTNNLVNATSSLGRSLAPSPTIQLKAA